MYESNWTLHSSVTGIPKNIYETRTDEWHTAWINPRVPSLGVDTERDFHPVVSSFHQTYKANKERSSYLGTGRALFTHKEPGGHYFSSRESCWHHVPSTSQQSQNVTLLCNFHGAPENILLQRNWNRAPFKPRAGESSPSTKLASNSAVHASELQQAR